MTNRKINSDSGSQPGEEVVSRFENEDILSEGLIDFYSAQAAQVRSQYQNINSLLGPTSDWTHPGTLCEELLRDFLRRTLFSWMSVDKGFIYGRSTLPNGKSAHSPEIDILVHDTRQFQPIYRTGDFVIVRPETVLGIIQVKRKLTSGMLNRGLKNVVQARRHLLNTHFWRVNQLNPIDPKLGQVFAAIIGFEAGLVGKAYQSRLNQTHDALKEFNVAGMGPTAVYGLPHYVGSLDGNFVICVAPSLETMSYQLYSSRYHDGKNIALQSLLASFFQVIGVKLQDRPLLAFRPGQPPLEQFSIPSVSS